MGQVPIVGAAVGPALGYWTLQYRSVSDANWFTFASGSNQVGSFNADGTVASTGTLATLDTSLMLDGQYEVALTVYDTDGKTAVDRNYVVIKGHQKIGYFTLSYTDMTIPIAGMPISVIRTYDSRDKSKGDFGVGWTLSTTTVKVQKPEVSAYNINQGISTGGGFGLAYYLAPQRSHNITITLPGDIVYSFAETYDPYYQQYYQMQATNIAYQQLSGPKATLIPVDSTSHQPVSSYVYILPAKKNDDPNYEINGIVNPNAVEFFESDLDTPYNPTQFQLTLHNGTKYIVDKSGGLISITDRNGNTVHFEQGKIWSDDNRAITITRGANGLITGITDMMGNTYQYAQDGAGNLISSTDRVGNTTTYDYDYQHDITDIKNPLGIMPIRNYYYPDGRLNYVLDAKNNKVSNFYDNSLEQGGAKPPSSYGIPVDANGYLQPGYQVTTDALGNPTLMQYDCYGNVTQKTQYLTDDTHTNTPVTWKYAYADSNNPDKETQMIDPMGNVTDMTYDPQGDLLTSTRYLTDATHTNYPVKTKATYDAYGQLLTSVDPLGNTVVSNTYDTNGNLINTTNALGNYTVFSYGSNGRLAFITDPKGAKTSYVYNREGQLVSIINPLGYSTNYKYDENGHIINVSKIFNMAGGIPNVITTQTVYDQSDRVIQSIGADLSSTYQHYDENGHVDYSINSLGLRTTFSYDSCGNQIMTSYPDGTYTLTYYDSKNRVIRGINKDGRAIQFTFDTLGRIIQSYPLDPTGNTLPDGRGGYIHTSKQYDLIGNVVSSTDENYNLTKCLYDSLGRKIKTIDALSHQTQLVYDFNNRIISRIDANGKFTNFIYDAVGRLVSTIYPDGSNTSSSYDSGGLKTSVTDQMGKTTRYLYDVTGQLISEINPMGYETDFGYDELGNLIWRTDANGHTTRFTYDNLGRIVQKTLPMLPQCYDNPNRQSSYFTYDSIGRIITTTDNNGIITTINYDPTTGEVTGKDASNGDWVRFDYNTDGTLKNAKRGHGDSCISATSYVYELTTGRLSSVT